MPPPRGSCRGPSESDARKRGGPRNARRPSSTAASGSRRPATRPGGRPWTPISARLTPAERKALEAEALAGADAETRQSYENAAPARFRASVLLGLVREHVAQELLRGVISAEG